MADQNDSFIREVNEELRSDQFRSVWDRYGRAIIALAVLIVVATAASGGYEYWVERRASKSGDEFLAALNLAKDGKRDESLAALESLQNEGYGAYPVLARMRAATVEAEKGNPAKAIESFSAIGSGGAVTAAGAADALAGLPRILTATSPGKESSRSVRLRLPDAAVSSAPPPLLAERLAGSKPYRRPAISISA